MSPWPLERLLFAIAGTMTLATVALAALVSPWWLLLTAFFGVSQWMYVTVGRYAAAQRMPPPGLASLVILTES